MLSQNNFSPLFFRFVRSKKGFSLSYILPFPLKCSTATFVMIEQRSYCTCSTINFVLCESGNSERRQLFSFLDRKVCSLKLDRTTVETERRKNISLWHFPIFSLLYFSQDFSSVHEKGIQFATVCKILKCQSWKVFKFNRETFLKFKAKSRYSF